MPYSSVGYKIQNIATTENPEIQRYNGSGGINKVFTGIGYQLTKELSVGADFQYNFGKIETTSIVYRDQVQYGTRETNSSNVSGLNINAGIAYQSKLTKKLTINSSITYTPEANLTLSNSRNIAVIAITTLGGASVVDDRRCTCKQYKIKIAI